MSGGGSSTPTTQQVTTNTSNLPEYAQPYFTQLLNQTQAAAATPYQPYQDASGNPINRIAGLTPAQLQTNQAVMNEGTTGFANAKGLTQQAGAADLAYKYDPSQFTSQTIQAPGGVANVDSSKFAVDPNQAAQMQAAQTGYNPNLTTFQIGAPQQFGQDQAQQYMSPYYQNVVDVQKAQALRDAQKAQVLQNVGAARQGTYGGARQLLATTENERNLNTQLGNIQATGSQAAYENAQQQFERDRAAGLGVASQNLQAQLGVQQLGTQTGMQTALANLSNEQQAAVQNQAAQLQMQGMNAQQALQAALANQQSGLTTQGMGLQAATSNQQANLQAQQAAEQSKQFGASSGLQALAQATQAASTEGGLAAQQQATDLARFQAQAAVGNQQQQQHQALLDQQYQDFLNQRAYPEQQLSYYSSILHGMPIGQDVTSTTAAPPPSAISQMAGLGLGALGIANLAGKG